jgi:phosphoribosylformylglycinamidine (FGAM) synthase PurS component
MLHHVEVAYKKQLTDPAGIAVMGDAKDLGIRGISDVRVTQLFVLDGDFTEKDAAHIAGEILSDPIINDFSIDKALPFQKDASHVVTVFRKPGVMDPVEASTKKAIRDIGLNARNVRTGKKFVIFGKVREKEQRRHRRGLLRRQAHGEGFHRQAVRVQAHPRPDPQGLRR